MEQFKEDSVYTQRIQIALAVYNHIVQQDYFLPYTCAGSSSVLQGVMRHFGHNIQRHGVTPVEQGPYGEQVHVVAYDQLYVYDLTYTQFRRLQDLGTPIIRREDFSTRFLLLPTLEDPLMCEPDFYKHYIHHLKGFYPKQDQ